MTEREHANGRGTDNLPSVFDICTPRKDIRDGIVESELAADLSQVIGGGGALSLSTPTRPSSLRARIQPEESRIFCTMCW